MYVYISILNLGKGLKAPRVGRGDIRKGQKQPFSRNTHSGPVGARKRRKAAILEEYAFWPSRSGPVGAYWDSKKAPSGPVGRHWRSEKANSGSFRGHWGSERANSVSRIAHCGSVGLENSSSGSRIAHSRSRIAHSGSRIAHSGS